MVVSGVSGKIFEVIKNLYKKTKSCVMVNSTRSDFFVTNVGVRQGENLSPLLFSLYVNDLENFLLMRGSSTLNFDYKVCNDLLKLMVLMYADDTVILSNTKLGLQKALDSLSRYCTVWKLAVNPSKTKVCVFGNRKYKVDKNGFMYNGKTLEIVHSFKYLGIIFNFNGRFALCKKHLASQASRAMFSLLSKGRKHELSIDTMLDLFDKMIVPILSYGCETWCYEECLIIERIHLKFCKYILKVKQSTPNVMIYGELGRYPLIIKLKLLMLGYWYDLINCETNKLSKTCYQVLLTMYEEETMTNPWIHYVKNVLMECGLQYVWVNQATGISKAWLKQVVKRTLQDIYIGKWHSDMEKSSKCFLYKDFKTEFVFEKYLLHSPFEYLRYLINYRLCNHKLPVETGRYINVERNERVCTFCDMNTLGDEYHYIMECSNVEISRVRNTVIPHYYRTHVNMIKFTMLMNQMSLNSNTCYKLGKLIKSIMTIVK